MNTTVEIVETCARFYQKGIVFSFAKGGDVQVQVREDTIPISSASSISIDQRNSVSINTPTTSPLYLSSFLFYLWISAACSGHT